MEPKDQRKVDDFILFGMAAAEQAVEDAGWMPEDEDGRERTGVMIGSGIGGLNSIAETALLLREKGPRRVSPFFIPGALINLISGQVSIRYGFKGPNHAVVTACSTGAHAIGDAARLITAGRCRRDGRRRRRGRDLRDRHCRLQRLQGAVDQARATIRKRPAAPMTPTATASSWARAPAWWCWRNTSTPRRAAPRSTPRCWATACRATPITSPRPPRTARAATGRCGRR